MRGFFKVSFKLQFAYSLLVSLEKLVHPSFASFEAGLVGVHFSSLFDCKSIRNHIGHLHLILNPLD